MPTLFRRSVWLLASTLVVLTAAEPVTPPAPASPWGFCSSAEWFGEYPRFNPLMAKAGVRWLRAFPEWSTIQPKPDVWNWQPADELVANARATGMGITGGLWYFAPWATPRGDTRSAPLKDIGAWSAYTAAAVGRYKDDIRDWEVYNEFNGSFANSANKPKDYADLVVAASAAAKRANPAARIGLSCANFDLGFFDGAIKAGASGKFDFVCVHPYENLGQLVDGGEPGYLSMAASLRKMLADNGQRSDIELWITEFGIQSTVAPDAAKDALQADILVKGHLLALAQGFARICWFEARGPAYGHGTDHGVLRQDWSPRPAYDAWAVLTRVLGQTPTYGGWLNLADGGYGFVFSNGATPLLTAWSSSGPQRQVTFASAVTVTDVLGKVTALPAGQPLVLGRSPVYIAGLPADLLAQAAANRVKPFPWGGDFANATSVACQLGATNTDNGISQRNPQTTEVVHKLDHSYRTSHRKNSEGIYAYFLVDPRFASFGNRALTITVVARRSDPAKAVSFDLTYESLTGYKGTGQRWEVPAGEEWVEHTWTVRDANFVGGWGWNFRTDIGGSPGGLAIKEVRVGKVVAEAGK